MVYEMPIQGCFSAPQGSGPSYKCGSHCNLSMNWCPSCSWKQVLKGRKKDKNGRTVDVYLWRPQIEKSKWPCGHFPPTAPQQARKGNYLGCIQGWWEWPIQSGVPWNQESILQSMRAELQLPSPDSASPGGIGGTLCQLEAPCSPGENGMCPTTHLNAKQGPDRSEHK